MDNFLARLCGLPYDVATTSQRQDIHNSRKKTAAPVKAAVKLTYQLPLCEFITTIHLMQKKKPGEQKTMQQLGAEAVMKKHGGTTHMQNLANKRWDDWYKKRGLKRNWKPSAKDGTTRSGKPSVKKQQQVSHA